MPRDRPVCISAIFCLNRPDCAVLVGHEPHIAISYDHVRSALRRLARARGARPGAGARHGDHRSRGLARTRSRPIWRSADDAAGPDRRTFRSAARNCSRCRRWRRSAGRSTASSIVTSPRTRRVFRTKPSASGRLRFPIVRSRAALFGGHALRAVRHRQPHGPRLCRGASCGEVRLIYRLTRTDAPSRRERRLATAADDAERRAEGEGRQCHRAGTARRSPAPRSRGAGLPPASCRSPARSSRKVAAGRSARSDRVKISTASKPICRSRTRRNRRCAIFAPTIS